MSTTSTAIDTAVEVTANVGNGAIASLEWIRAMVERGVDRSEISAQIAVEIRELEALSSLAALSKLAGVKG